MNYICVNGHVLKYRFFSEPNRWLIIVRYSLFNFQYAFRLLTNKLPKFSMDNICLVNTLLITSILCVVQTSVFSQLYKKNHIKIVENCGNIGSNITSMRLGEDLELLYLLILTKFNSLLLNSCHAHCFLFILFGFWLDWLKAPYSKVPKSCQEQAKAKSLNKILYVVI
ncbi:hypothetical protein F4703DRAFT_1913534 [Phycomyces blakesleeanus]